MVLAADSHLEESGECGMARRGTEQGVTPNGFAWARACGWASGS